MSELLISLLTTNLERHNVMNRVGCVFNVDESGFYLNTNTKNLVTSNGNKVVLSIQLEDSLPIAIFNS